jgi:hypothetical protein
MGERVDFLDEKGLAPVPFMKPSKHHPGSIKTYTSNTTKQLGGHMYHHASAKHPNTAPQTFKFQIIYNKLPFFLASSKQL